MIGNSKINHYRLDVPPKPVASRKLSPAGLAPPPGLASNLNFLFKFLFPQLEPAEKIFRHIISKIILNKICLKTDSAADPASLQLLVLGIVPAGGIPFPGMKFRTVFRIIFDIVQQMQHIIIIMKNGKNKKAG